MKKFWCVSRTSEMLCLTLKPSDFEQTDDGDMSFNSTPMLCVQQLTKMKKFFVKGPFMSCTQQY